MHAVRFRVGTRAHRGVPGTRVARPEGACTTLVRQQVGIRGDCGKVWLVLRVPVLTFVHEFQ